jgi:hypothetical protein
LPAAYSKLGYTVTFNPSTDSATAGKDLFNSAAFSLGYATLTVPSGQKIGANATIQSTVNILYIGFPPA